MTVPVEEVEQPVLETVPYDYKVEEVVPESGGFVDDVEDAVIETEDVTAEFFPDDPEE